MTQPHLERRQLLGEEQTVLEWFLVVEHGRQLSETDVQGQVPRLPVVRVQREVRSIKATSY